MRSGSRFKLRILKVGVILAQNERLMIIKLIRKMYFIIDLHQ